MQEKLDFKTSVRALMKEDNAVPHPSAEALAAFRNEDLPADEEARVHAHLEGCRECTELAQDLDLFTQAPQPEKADNEFEVASFLRTLKPQLAPEPPAETKMRHRPLAVAASLILAVTASWWLSHIVTKRQLMTELSQPRANVEIVDFYVGSIQRDGSTPAYEINFDLGGTLVLSPSLQEIFPRYELRVFAAGETPEWTVENLELHPASRTLTLWIPPGFLTPGDYRAELVGLDGSRAEPIAEFSIKVAG